MILKNDTQGSFVIVNQCIMHDKSLKLFDRGLLVTLMSLPDNWNFSINGLATILSDGRDSIRGGIDRLQEKGYLIKEQMRKNGKFSDICLRINVAPNKPLSEKPTTGKPTSDKSVSSNATQLNNKESNIYRSNKNGCHGGVRKEVDNGRNKHNHKDKSKNWSEDEINLYGLHMPDL